MSSDSNEKPNAICVFTIVIGADGVPGVYKYEGDTVRPLRDPSNLDIRRAVLELSADYAAVAAAEHLMAAIEKASDNVSDRLQSALDGYTPAE